MSVQLSSKYSSNQPYHVYYTMDLLNNDTSSPQQPVLFNYNENRNNPFLNSPENYFMSIVRFSIETPSLPVFVPQIAISTANTRGPNQTAYNITLTQLYGGVTYTETVPIMYVPTNTTLTAPTTAPNLTVADITSEYYYMYNIGQWVSAMNTAFSLAYLGGVLSNGDAITGLRVRVIAAGQLAGNISANPPFVEWNPVDQVIILNADLGTALISGFATNESGGTPSGFAVPTKIYFNTPLASLYCNFPYISGPVSLTTASQVVVLSVNNTNTYTVPSPSYTAVQVYQEGGTTISLFNPVVSIVFQSTLLPVAMENIGQVKISTGGLVLNNFAGNNANVNPIITDFQVPVSALNTYRPDISYIPSGEYRLVDMYGTSPASAINLQVYWKDIYGNLNPFYLSSGCGASIKVMFRRKDFNTQKLFNSI